LDTLSSLQLALACFASLAAGFVDSIVGGGGLIQLPALLLLFPNLEFGAVSAINKSASFCGTLFAFIRYARVLPIQKQRVSNGCAVAFAAACIGAFLSAHAPTGAIKRFALLALVAVACFTFFKPKLGNRVFFPNIAALAKLVALAGVVGFYDGFFGPGTGSFFVFGLVTLIGLDFLHASAEAKALNLATNLAAILTLAMAGFSDLKLSAVLAIFNVTGSYFGTKLALKKGTVFVRRFFIAVVIAMISKLAMDVIWQTQGTSAPHKAQTTPRPVLLTLLHTNDLHSQFLGMGPDRLYTPKPDGDPVIGGYARMATLISHIREQKAQTGEPVLLVDAGDFYAGSLFHALAVSQRSPLTPELSFFDSLSYDAVTLGNHEFDAGEAGLDRMLDKANQNGLKVPIAVSTEVNRGPNDPQAVRSGSSNLQQSPLARHYDPGESARISRAIVRKISYQNTELTVCIYGAMGPDALFSSAVNRKQISFAGYNDTTESKEAKPLAHALRDTIRATTLQNHCAFNILLLHGGNPEDTALANDIPEINVIVAGHTHDVYLKKQGNTWISQAGHGGSHLGMMEFLINGSEVTLLTPEEKTHLPINDQITDKLEQAEAIEEARHEINRLSQGAQNHFESPIADVKEDIPHSRDYPNNPLASKLFEKIRLGINHCLAAQRPATPAAPAAPQTEGVAAYFSTLSLIRGGLVSDSGRPVTYQYSDIFRIFSVGFDAELNPGNPVSTFYLKREELGDLLEFFDLYRNVSALATPGFSESLRYQVRSWGIPMVNRTYERSLDGKAYAEWPALVHLATNETIIANLNKITTLSKGFVNLRPRNRTGDPAAPKRLNCPDKEHELLANELLRSGL
jgi:2',3'-cyclic-nucleotide 2'-phosphodiesterase (5'-nucleotidase family)/uncharacterized membrane protein YfcA